MMSVRRFIGSLVVGGLLLAAAAGSAHAGEKPVSDVMMAGVAIGAASALRVQAEPPREGIETAIAALDKILDRRSGKPGRGPEHARQVLEEILEEGPPGLQVRNEKLATLAGAYAELHARAEEKAQDR